MMWVGVLSKIQMAPSILACAQLPTLRKKIWEEHQWFTVDNRVQYRLTFPGMYGKWFDWLLPLDHYNIETTSFD